MSSTPTNCASPLSTTNSRRSEAQHIRVKVSLQRALKHVGNTTDEPVQQRGYVPTQQIPFLHTQQKHSSAHHSLCALPILVAPPASADASGATVLAATAASLAQLRCSPSSVRHPVGGISPSCRRSISSSSTHTNGRGSSAQTAWQGTAAACPPRRKTWERGKVTD